MTRDDNPEFREWLDEARSASFDVAMQLCGFTPKKGFEKSVDRAGPCPACGGDDRFSVHMVKRIFNCRKCGKNGHDALDLAMVGKPKGEFLATCEELAGRPRPGRATVAPMPIDHDRQSMRDEADKDARALAAAKDRAGRDRKANWAEDVWNGAKVFSGSQGERYWRLRGLNPLRGCDDFLGFLPEFPVRENGIEVGQWPCIVAPMRNRAMAITGLHCTFLDRKEPIKAEILMTSEDGSRRSLNPKRMYGTIGIVWLSELRAELAIAEGVETARGWLQCGYGNLSDPALASACSLGGLSGGAVGTRPHPTVKGRTIPNGEPDPAKPGFLAHLPDEVKSVLILGDCDMPAHNGLAHYQTMARRCLAAGLDGGVQFPLQWPWNRKFDWADLAKFESEQPREESAA